jgi:hypothetical protein
VPPIALAPAAGTVPGEGTVGRTFERESRVPPKGTTVLLRYDLAKPSSVNVRAWDAPASVTQFLVMAGVLAAGVVLVAVGVLVILTGLTRPAGAGRSRSLPGARAGP